MPTWKLNIFVRVVTRRIKSEGRIAEDILTEYPALTTAEKTEIIATINNQ